MSCYFQEVDFRYDNGLGQQVGVIYKTEFYIDNQILSRSTGVDQVARETPPFMCKNFEGYL